MVMKVAKEIRSKIKDEWKMVEDEKTIEHLIETQDKPKKIKMKKKNSNKIDL